MLTLNVGLLVMTVFLILQDSAITTAPSGLNNTAAELGSTVAFVCSHSQSTLCWEFQKAPADFPTSITSNSPKYNIAVNDNYSSVLSIESVQMADAGLYTCRLNLTTERSVAELVVSHSRCRMSMNTVVKELDVACDVKYSTSEPPSVRCITTTQVNITDERLWVTGPREVSYRLTVAVAHDLQGNVFDCYARFRVTAKNGDSMATNDPEEVHIWTSPSIDLKGNVSDESVLRSIVFSMSAVLGFAVVVIIVLSVCRIRVAVSKPEATVIATQTADDVVLSPNSQRRSVRHTTVFDFLYAKIVPRSQRGVGHVNQSTAGQQDAHSLSKSSGFSQCPLLMNSRSTYAEIDAFDERTSSFPADAALSQPNNAPQSTLTTVPLLNSRSTYADIDEFLTNTTSDQQEHVPASRNCSTEPLLLLNSRSTYADIDEFGSNNIESSFNTQSPGGESTTDSKAAGSNNTEIEETSTVVPEAAARADFGYTDIRDLDAERRAQLVNDASPTSLDSNTASVALRQHL